MNKRLRELMVQADYAAPEIALRAQKLAELVVKECLSQVDKIRDSLEEDGEDQQALGADWAGLAIAQHFGVDE